VIFPRWNILPMFDAAKGKPLGGYELFEFSQKFVELIKAKDLEVNKQKAVYVGLNRLKGKVDVDSRVSIPTKVVSQTDAKR
jgi:hypothetical protein